MNIVVILHINEIIVYCIFYSITLPGGHIPVLLIASEEINHLPWICTTVTVPRFWPFVWGKQLLQNVEMVLSLQNQKQDRHHLFGSDRPPVAGVYLLSPWDCGPWGTSCIGTGRVGRIERDKIVTPKKPFLINFLRADWTLPSVYNPQREFGLPSEACV